MTPRLAAALILIGVVACGPNKDPTVLYYKTIGGACISATGVINTITPMINRGQLTLRQIMAFEASINIIDPICSAGDIPDYEWALTTLNEQILLLDDIIRQASG